MDNKTIEIKDKDKIIFVRLMKEKLERFLDEIHTFFNQINSNSVEESIFDNYFLSCVKPQS